MSSLFLYGVSDPVLEIDAEMQRCALRQRGKKHGGAETNTECETEDQKLDIRKSRHLPSSPRQKNPSFPSFQ